MAQGQQALRRLIEGRLTFTPDEGFYAFRGKGTIEPVLAGVVQKLASPGDETPFTWPGWRCGGWRRRVLRFASHAEEKEHPMTHMLKFVLYGLAVFLVLVLIIRMIGSTTTSSEDDGTDALVTRLIANDPLIAPLSPR